MRRSPADEVISGEEPQVVWELKPNAPAHEQLALLKPTRVDDPCRPDAFLAYARHVESNVSLGNEISFAPHCYKPKPTCLHQGDPR